MTSPPRSAGAADDPPSTLKEQRKGAPGLNRIQQSYLFVALEADRPWAGGARYALRGLQEVVVIRGDERAARRETRAGIQRLVLTLPGRWLSGQHARLFRTEGGWVLQDEGSTNGSYVNGARASRAFLRPGDVVEVGHTFLLVGTHAAPAAHEPVDCDSRALPAAPVGFATLIPPLADRLAELARVAASPISVVLTGATGTGKEILARGIHALSRRKGPLVAVNCGALTQNLVESQLFGHVKGAFSGAVADARGFVRSAEGGTLLLDEIGDLPRAAQPALLRVLQEREVVPVGSARAQRVDVRFVSTSPRPLAELVARGDLRPDLLARLQTFEHALPPLVERREDIGLLAEALLSKHGVEPGQEPRLAPELALSFLRHDWPLNVRELEQTLLRGWTLANDGVIDLPPLVPASAAPPAGTGWQAPDAPAWSPAEADLRDRLVQELTSARGNVAEVARKMGKARMQVQRWMRRFGVDPDSFRG